jgi:hypothetical protein
MKGFSLTSGSPVKIIKGEKISVKHGGYLYTIEVINPKNKQKIILDGWLTQNDLMTKDMHEKHLAQEKLIAELEEKLNVNS